MAHYVHELVALESLQRHVFRDQRACRCNYLRRMKSMKQLIIEHVEVLRKRVAAQKDLSTEERANVERKLDELRNSIPRV